MASGEELATAVLGLLADVKAIQTEQQLKLEMFQGMETKIATLSTAREVQAVKDAQAVLDDATEQQLGTQNNQQLNPDARLHAIVARLDGLERSSAGLSPGAAGSKGWQLTRPKRHGAPRVHGERGRVA